MQTSIANSATHLQHPQLYLASGSPRRRELLQQIGVNHQVVSVSILEKPLPNENHWDYVQRLALEKAEAGFAEVVRQQLSMAPVLGADTLGMLEGKLLEKPRDQQDAKNMLLSMSGKTHEVITAVALVDQTRRSVKVSKTYVSFRELSEKEIAAYWLTGEPQDKAGGYAIQGLGAVFVKEIRGSYSGVVGLPLEITCELLKEFSVAWWSNE
jgi:septum formation protein